MPQKVSGKYALDLEGIPSRLAESVVDELQELLRTGARPVGQAEHGRHTDQAGPALGRLGLL
ncbi:hypothetical protein DACRYDRAFT_22374 [Dacryopinax primogenitus]|uniref:Uncharacterized protein n=1 Tax=Dacryopinax primogenitus (strain DJM 731) TaxID=1858805 RepID=M5GCS3_DACPD|nr:uncharacterized protein DACRYDRAFT_22374 [Dacryopinax primogenitus]EJU01943.1 hypothetical protein DACRYDRAFT_22374 [Dacryopinax primogenitus]